MKVWLLLSRFANGGLERVQINLANALKLRGMDIEVVIGRMELDPRTQLLDGVQVTELAPETKLSFPLALRRHWSKQAPDVIITSANDVACLTLLFRSIDRRRTRVVASQHLSLSAPRLAATGLTRLKLESLRKGMRLLFPRADAVIAVSAALSIDMQAELGLQSAQIDVVHNPIVLPELGALINERTEWPWPDSNVPTLVFVGRLAPEKRPDLLLGAFRRMRDRSARLLIVGDGPCAADIRSQIRKHGLEARVRLVGQVSNVYPLISRCKALVLCSDYEGFGNVLVEAMACGTQVVATDCPNGPAEILEGGAYGWLVPCDDASALAQAMEEAISDWPHVSPDRLRARANDFTLERAVEAYVGILNRLSPVLMSTCG
ncbi:glycosyltransferase [Pseudoxanthomonas mexicana]